MTNRKLPPWPDDLKSICSENSAERGESACWHVDEFVGAITPEYGSVCDECWRAWRQTEPKP